MLLARIILLYSSYVFLDFCLNIIVSKITYYRKSNKWQIVLLKCLKQQYKNSYSVYIPYNNCRKQWNWRKCKIQKYLKPFKAKETSNTNLKPQFMLKTKMWVANRNIWLTKVRVFSFCLKLKNRCKKYFRTLCTREANTTSWNPLLVIPLAINKILQTHT